MGEKSFSLGLYLIDCMEGMKGIPDDSIDLTLTDIPYDGVNSSREGGGYMAGEDIGKHFSDSIIMGYGLYSCKVHQTEDGRYICTYQTGNSCE